MNTEATRIAQATLATAEKLAKSYHKGDDALFYRAKVVYAATEAGQTIDAIALATSKARVRLTHPDLSADMVDVLAGDSAYSVKRSDVDRLNRGYRLAVKSGVSLSAATVSAAWRAISRTGVSDELSTLERNTLALDRDERDAQFIAGCAEIVGIDNERKRVKRAAIADEKAANGNTDTGEIVGGTDTSGDTAPVSVPPSVDDLIASVEALTARFSTLSTADKARVFDAYSALYAAIEADTATVSA